MPNTTIHKTKNCICATSDSFCLTASHIMIIVFFVCVWFMLWMTWILAIYIYIYIYMYTHTYTYIYYIYIYIYIYIYK